jgi:hypothetical protein
LENIKLGFCFRTVGDLTRRRIKRYAERPSDTDVAGHGDRIARGLDRASND